MTFEQLRIFVAVAEHQHVTRAARELHLTQSAASAAIAALEARYATKLFDRVGRRIVLTEAGGLFLAEAKAVLARAAAAEKVLVDLSQLTRGSLALAASQTVAGYWLPRLIQLYRTRHPGVAVSLGIGNSAAVAALVRDGGADLGVIEDAIDDPLLAATAVAEDELLVVAPAGHAWSGRPPRRPAELAAGPWVLREPGSGTRALLERGLGERGLATGDLTVALELPSNEAVRAAVEAGAGVAALSRLVVGNALLAGSLAAVDLALPRRRFLALRHKERHATRATRAFLDLLAEA